MIGNPKYKKGDIVTFDINIDDEVIEYEGKVYIVDKYGTFLHNDDVSYDVMVENYNDTGERLLVKHIKESNIK